MNWRNVERPKESAWYIGAESWSRGNRLALGRSPSCGCFHCLHMLAFRDIQEWTDAPYGTPPIQYNEKGNTARCPHCGFDTIIASSSSFPITEDLLREMHAYWFAPGPDYEFVQRTRPQPQEPEKSTPHSKEDEDACKGWHVADKDHIEAHAASFKNRASIKRSMYCGCFYCLKIFYPDEITIWWDSPKGTPRSLDNAMGQTATCSYCGIDSVIGSDSGYPITTEFLREMSEYWF